MDTVTAQKQRQSRLEQLRNMQLNRQDQIDSPKNIIKKAVMQKFPQVDSQEAGRITREMVLAPKSSSIKIGHETVKVSDLSFQIAESLEAINSETSSSQEYFNWFTESSDILKHMNDGYVSEEDLKERNDWITDSYTREAEMMTCLGLYQNSSFPEAKKRYAEIYNKLVKLRQLRNTIKDNTANKADAEQNKVNMEEKEKAFKKATLYLAVLRQFSKRSPRFNLSKRNLRKLNMYHGDDYDLEGDYDDMYGDYENDDFDERTDLDIEREIYDQQLVLENSYRFDDMLKENVLFNWDDNENAAHAMANSYSPAEQYLEQSMPAAEENVEDIRTRIARLSGRRPPLKARPLGYDMDRARAFDATRFQALRQRAERQSS